MEDSISYTELSRLFSLAIYQLVEKNKHTSESSKLLAETYIRLQELIKEPMCITKNESEINPDPALLSAIGTLVYINKVL